MHLLVPKWPSKSKGTLTRTLLTSTDTDQLFYLNCFYVPTRQEFYLRISDNFCGNVHCADFQQHELARISKFLMEDIFSIFFLASTAPLCGNQLLDEGEECDCGFRDSCAALNDNCCGPGDIRNISKRCKLTESAECRFVAHSFIKYYGETNSS